MNRIVSIILLLIFVTTAHAVYWACSPVEGGKITGEDKAKLAIPNAGYKFLYWKSQANNGTPSYKYENPADLSGCAFLEAFRPEVTVYVTAFFEKSQEIYDTISFNACGGVIPASGNMGTTPEGHDTGLSADQQTGYVVVTQGQPYFDYMSNDCPSKSGSIFKGWFTSKDDGEQVYDSAGAYIVGNYWDNNGKWKGTSNVTLYAHWNQLQYTISTTSTNGTITGGGTYNYGDTVTLTAIPNVGYHFTQWSDGNTDNPRQLIVTRDSTLIAEFEVNTFDSLFIHSDCNKNGVTIDFNTNGKENGHAWVDLGLPSKTKWATCNIGANSPEEYGEYYAWGETETKTTFTPKNYQYSQNPGVLPLSADVAAKKWAGNWHMPSYGEFEELMTYCTWSWTNVNGKNGYNVLGQNGNTIFLPAAGCRVDGLKDINAYGHYWSTQGVLDEAQSLYFSSSNVTWYGNCISYYCYYGTRYEGKTIRSICNTNPGTSEKQIKVVIASSNCDTINQFYISGTTTTILMANTDATIKFIKWSDGNTTNPRIVTISSDTTFTAIYAKECTITAPSNDSTMGHVNGGGTVLEGSSASLYAFANKGYHFVKWSDGYTNNPRTVIISSDTTFVAEFAPDPKLTVQSNDEKLGSALITEELLTYSKQLFVLFTLPNSWKNPFVWDWTGSGTGHWMPLIKLENTKYVYLAPSDHLDMLIANFPEWCTISDIDWSRKTAQTIDLHINDRCCLKVDSDQDYAQVSNMGCYGIAAITDIVKINANPTYKGIFENWSDGVTMNPRYVLVSSDSTIIANFIPNQYTITTVSTCGTITGGGIYSLGDTATLAVTPDEGCHFTQWSDGNTENPRQVIVNKDSTFIAEFSVDAAGDVEYVDLGLSVLWATCNLGATKSTEAGNYYAWGELEPKKVYNWETYKFWAGKYSNVTKYVHSSQYGDVDNKTQLEYIDDAARYKYGKGWHIPTKQECQELVDSCVWTRIVDGTNGYVVTSLINGKSIFLPVTGYYIDTLLYSMSNGYFISSSINTRHPLFYGVEYEWKYDRYQTYSSCNRQYGYPIRPVCDKHVLMYNVQVLSEYGSASGSGQYSEGSIAQLSASTEDSCYVFVQWSDGNTDNPRKLVVTQDTTLTAEFDQIKYNITLDSDAERGEVVEE